MVTVPEVGVGAVVSVMVGASGPGLPSVGVVSVAVPDAGVVPPPGRLPTASMVYAVSGVRPGMGQSRGLVHVTVMGEPPPTGVAVTV